MRVLDWDSDFFGLRIARADVDGELEVPIEQARTDGVECLYLFLPGASLETASEAIRRGAILTDLRLVLTREGAPSSDRPVHRATAADAATVEELAVRLAAFSRFARDPRVPSERVEAMYRLWARSCLDGGVVTLDTGNDGLVGVRVTDDVARVNLVYVGPTSSGGGVARALIAAALEDVAAPRAEVATQFGNVPALRVYEALGFRVSEVRTILHVWLDTWR